MDLSFLPKIIEENFGRDILKKGYSLGMDMNGIYIEIKGDTKKKRKKLEKALIKTGNFDKVIQGLEIRENFIVFDPVLDREETMESSEEKVEEKVKEKVEEKIEEELNESMKKVQPFKGKGKAKAITLKDRLETPDSNVRKENDKKVSKSQVQEVVQKITDDTIEMEKEAFNQLVDKNDHRFNSKSEKIQAEINKNLIEAKDLLRPANEVSVIVRDTKSIFSNILVSKFNLQKFPEEFRKPKINYFVSV